MNYNLIRNKTPEIVAPEGTPSLSFTRKIVVPHAQDKVNGGWYGRANVITRHDGIVILFYNEGESHSGTIYEQHHIRFSSDYGITWSEEDKYLDGTAITNFPMYPVDSAPGDNRGTSEIYPVLCPNGDIIAHMWASNYNTNNDGSHFTRSTDGGLTWSTPVKLTSVTNSDSPSLDTLLGGEQCFVLRNNIYLCTRDFRNSYGGFQNNLVLISSDNGANWSQLSRVTNTSTSGEGGKEMSIAFVGNNKFIGFTRWFDNEVGRKLVSLNRGESWNVSEDDSILNEGEGLGRTVIKQRSLVKGKKNFWLDPVLIMVGFVHQSSGDSSPRRNCCWVSTDFGETWSKPMYFEDTDQEDGGYGDFFYNPLTDEYVYMSYYNDDFFNVKADIVQYNFKITWE